MMHLAAFYQSVDPAGALTKINAVPDTTIFTSGADVRIPTGIANLLAVAALSSATGPVYAQVQSPTLRDLADQDVEPVVAAAKFTAYDSVNRFMDNPRALTVGESVNFAIEAKGGAAADNYGLIWLGDGPTKTSSGKIFSVRATGAAALAAGTWVNTAITFNTTLPAGSYDIVGLRAQGANLIASRLVLIGATFRPGVPASSSPANDLFPDWRYGRVGTLGSFDTNQPPTMDCIGATDAAQEFILDLIKTK